MTTADEVQKAITDLPKSEYDKLIRWLQEYDWEQWDRELEEDVEAGRLDFLAERVAEARRQGTLKDL